MQVDRRLAYEKLSDPILVTRAKHGDSRALEVLLERHAPKVERLALHILRDPDDARDAAQEVLAKVCQRLGQFRGDAQFSTWLHRVALNTCRDAHARRRVHEPLEEELQAGHDVSELRRELCDSLTRVPPAQARAVLGHALAGPLRTDGARGYGAGAMISAEALASVVLETSEEPLFVTNVDLTQARIGGLGTDVVRRFLEVLAENAGLVLHVRLLNGTDSGHVLEAIFKGLGAALAEACERQEGRR